MNTVVASAERKLAVSTSIVSVWIFSLVALAGCASTPAAKIAKLPDTADIVKEIEDIHDDLTKAVVAQEDILSPQNFRHATLALEEVKTARDNSESRIEVLEKISATKAWLQDTHVTSVNIRGRIQNLIGAREDAINARARDFYRYDFARLDEETKALTADMEKGEFQSVDGGSRYLSARYRDLEVMAVTRSSVSDAENTILNAVTEGAERSAPEILHSAYDKLDQAKKAIILNPKDRPIIRKLATAATLEADRLFFITREARPRKAEKQEHVVLASAPLDNIANKAENARIQTEQQRDMAQKEIAGSELLDLESKESLKREAEHLKSKFNSNEADVRQVGSKIHIQLKALAFESQNENLSKNSLPLMSKVEAALSEINSSEVTIESHAATDSAEAKETAGKRAKTVENYLVQRKAVDPSSVATAVSSSSTNNGEIEVIVGPERARR